MATDLVTPEIWTRWRWSLDEMGEPTGAPSDAQCEFFLDFHHRLLAMVGGYGSGKTHALGHKAVALSMINPGLTIGAVAPSYPAAKQDLIPAIIYALDINGVDFRFNRSELKIDLIDWPGQIKIATADKPDTLKGPNWAAAVGNEPGIWSHESYLNLLSRVRHPLSNVRQVALAGTPEEFNWLYEETIGKYPDAPLGTNVKCRVIFTSTRSATWLAPDYLESLLETYSDELIESKVEGQFVPERSGRVYSTFDRTVNVIRHDYDQYNDVYLTCDFNARVMCWCVFQRYHWGDVCIDEIHRARPRPGESATQSAARDFCAKYGDHRRAVFVYGDYYGDSARSNAAQTDYDIIAEILRKQFPNRVYMRHKPTSSPGGNPPVVSRVNTVNGRLRNAKGESRLFIDPRCTFTVKDFERVCWTANGKRDIDKSTDVNLTHHSDAVGYLMWALYGTAQKAAYSSGSANYEQSSMGQIDKMMDGAV